MRIYISIPITGQNLATQRVKAAEVAEKIRALGHEAVNPFDTPEPPAELLERERYAYFIGEDIKRLLMCDAIFMCKGWQDSKGCKTEFGTAMVYKLKLFSYVDKIPST